MPSPPINVHGVSFPPFGNLKVHFATSLTEVKKKYPENIYEKVKQHFDAGSYGVAIHADGGTIIPEIGGMLVFLYIDNLKADEYTGVKMIAAISHEMVHITAGILERIGAMPNGIEDSEVFAHIQGWLVEEFLLYLGYE